VRIAAVRTVEAVLGVAQFTITAKMQTGEASWIAVARDDYWHLVASGAALFTYCPGRVIHPSA
jgi:hypothetical protein